MQTPKFLWTIVVVMFLAAIGSAVYQQIQPTLPPLPAISSGQFVASVITIIVWSILAHLAHRPKFSVLIAAKCTLMVAVIALGDQGTIALISFILSFSWVTESLSVIQRAGLIVGVLLIGSTLAVLILRNVPAEDNKE